jgi:hypothetical protein
MGKIFLLYLSSANYKSTVILWRFYANCLVLRDSSLLVISTNPFKNDNRLFMNDDHPSNQEHMSHRVLILHIPALPGILFTKDQILCFFVHYACELMLWTSGNYFPFASYSHGTIYMIAILTLKGP